MKKVKRFLMNAWVVAIASVVYIGVIGPALMSAPSDMAVIINLIALTAIGRWIYVVLKRTVLNNYNHH